MKSATQAGVPLVTVCQEGVSPGDCLTVGRTQLHRAVPHSRLGPENDLCRGDLLSDIPRHAIFTASRVSVPGSGMVKVNNGDKPREE